MSHCKTETERAREKTLCNHTAKPGRGPHSEPDKKSSRVAGEEGGRGTEEIDAAGIKRNHKDQAIIKRECRMAKYGATQNRTGNRLVQPPQPTLN